MSFAPLPEHARPQELARYCGVSLRTARRWKALGHMPRWAAVGFALLRDGDLGVISPEWRGWLIRRGELISPENWCFSPGEVVAIPSLYGLIRALERDLRRPGPALVAEPRRIADAKAGPRALAPEGPKVAAPGGPD